MEYPVYLGEDEVGVARVSKEGLYYRIQCICHLSSSSPLRITAEAERAVDLGLCIPKGNSSGLEVRIPMKKMGEGNLRFYIRKQDKHMPENWFPVSPEEPFQYIAKLKNAYMVSRDGKAGIVFRCTNQFPDQPDNDRNP